MGDTRNNLVHVRWTETTAFVVVWLFCLVVLGQAAELDAKVASNVSLPPKGMKTRDVPSAAKATYSSILTLADQKYNQASIMFNLGRWQDCIDICDGILALAPSHKKANALKNKATSSRLSEETRNLDVERTVRDSAALRLVTKDGLLPHRESDRPRPELTENDVPFPAGENVNQDAKRLLGQRLPLINLIDTDLNYVLQLLFKTTGVNIIYNPADIVDKTVTIYARDLTLEDILNYLSRSYGIGYTVNKGTVWVYAADNADAERALMRPVVIPLRTGLTTTTGGAAAGGQGGGAAGAVAAAVGGAATQVPSDIENMLTWMEANWPGWPAESRWTLDRKGNRLIIASTPDIIEEVRKIVRMLDVPPIQVLVVARFVNIGEQDYSDLGIQWGVTQDPATAVNTTDDKGQWKDNKFRFNSANLGTLYGSGTAAAGLTGILNHHKLEVTLNALKETSGTKVLTAPRVIAINNRTSTITVQDVQPYQSDVRTETVTTSNDNNSTSTTTLIPEWDTVDLGYALTVTPSVGSDMKTIHLHVQPTITESNDSVKKDIVVTNPGDDTPSTVTIERPIVNEQKLDVYATVQDGETLVVGGLFRDNDVNSKSAVPLLSKLPIIGSAFKSSHKVRDRSCLLIFVTARIIAPDNRLYTDDVDQAKRDMAEDDINAGRAVNVDLLNDWLGDPKSAPRAPGVQ